MPTSLPTLELDPTTLTVTPNLGNEILLFARNPEAVAVALHQWAQDFGLVLDLQRPLSTYSGGEQVLLVAGLWAILLQKHPQVIVDLRRAVSTLSATNRTRLHHALTQALPQATILLEEEQVQQGEPSSRGDLSP